MVTFQAGNFEESAEVIHLLLTFAFLGKGRVASQLFFWRFSGLLGAVAEDTLDALMEDTLTLYGYS